MPQPSVADAVPNDEFICAVVGLHVCNEGAVLSVIVGATTSSVQFTVLEVVAVFPQASVAVNVLVWDLEHPLLTTAASDVKTVGVPQASVAVAEPSDEFICAVVGLHDASVGAVLSVIVGAVTSTVHVTVLDTVAVLPQASVAVNVLV